MKVLPYLRNRKFLLKVFSFLFSLFIWLYVYSSAETEKNVSVKINIEYPQGLSNSLETPRFVNYRVKGPRVFVSKFSDKIHSINMKIKRNKYNYRKKFNVDLNLGAVKLPLSVKLVSRSVERVNIKLEKTVYKEVPIKIRYSKRLDAKFRLKEIKLEQKKVTIFGAKSIIKNINEIETQDFAPQNRMQKTMSLELLNIDSRVSMSQDKVEVNFNIIANSGEYTHHNIPIIFQTSALLKNVDKRKVSITVKGNLDLISKSPANLIKAFVEISDISSKNQFVDIKTTLPIGMELIKIVPEKIRVELE